MANTTTSGNEPTAHRYSVVGVFVVVVFVSALAWCLIHIRYNWLQWAVQIMLPLLTAFGMLRWYRSGKAARLRRRLAIGAAAGSVLLAVGAWGYCATNAYHTPEIDRTALYARGRVLVIVPHQDDDTNLMAGLTEELIRAGSDVYILFTTNGDRRGIKNAAKRVREVLKMADFYGIPHDHIYYLGYADAWQQDNRDLYNTAEDEAMIGYSGATETWAPEGVRILRPGRSYTKRHWREDMSEVIRTLHPDMLVCIDYDNHPGHRAASCMFEEVMADILRTEPDYTPFVLKGFAYRPCWRAPKDFYEGENLRSSRVVQDVNLLSLSDSEGRMDEVSYFTWEQRLRWPVSPKGLTHYMRGNSMYEAFTSYKFQHPPYRALPNGDKVMWWRPTGNLLLRAAAESDSGDAAQAHDFKVADSVDIMDPKRKPFDNGWCPKTRVGSIEFTLAEPKPIEEIWLYDHPDPANRVLSGRVVLGSGREIPLPPLPAGGEPLVLRTDCTEPQTGFRIEITQSTGPRAGLAEVEAYEHAPVSPVRIAKAVDVNDDFMYDYTVPKDGEVKFRLYTYPIGRQADYCVEGPNGPLQSVDGWYTLQVKPGEECIVTVLDREGRIADRVRLYNTPGWLRCLRRFYRTLDPLLY